MYRAGIFVATCAASLWMLASAHAQDSSDEFLKAFQNYQTAEKMEREDKPREALDRYRATIVLLEKISKADPEWQPSIIEYRLKKSRENVSRLETVVATMPPAPDSPEGPLPQADSSLSSLLSSPAPRQTTATPQSRRSTTSSSRTSEVSTSDLPRSGTTLEQIRELRAMVLQLRRENEKLSENILNERALRQAARMEVDKTKVTVVELKTELAQAKATLENAETDQTFAGAQRLKTDVQLREAQQKLADTEADNAVMTEEIERLRAEVDQAAKYITSSDEIRENLLKERTALNTEKNTALARTKRIKDNAAEMEKVTAENKTLKTKVAELEKAGATRAEVEKLAAENKELTEKLADAQLASVPKKDMDKLVAEKAELEKKYAQAEQQLKDATAAVPDKDKMVSSLQSELNSVNDRLLEAQARQSRDGDQIRDLQRQLDESSGELAKVKILGLSAREQRNIAAENELLRGIILREIKEQTKRDEAKKALEQEIAGLQVKSTLINDQLAVLGAPTLQLTDEERSLFKEPMVLLSEPNAQSLEVALTMTKPSETPSTQTNSQSADSLPPAAQEQIRKAQQLFDTKNPQNYAEVEKIYQDIVEEVPDNYFALSNLGAVQIEAGKLSAAEVALKRAIEINPGDAFAYRCLGIAYSRQGRFDDAIAMLKQALVINDNDKVGHNYLGICLGQKGNPTESEAELKRAIDIDPNYSDAHFNLAVLYATNQPPSIDLAKLHYNKATELGAAPDASLERLMQ